MTVAILAAVVGALIAAACLTLPRYVGRRNNPEDVTDALAGEKETGRSVQDIEAENAAERARQQEDSDHSR